MRCQGSVEQTVAIVILAAGLSRRLGRPKQLLPYRGNPLLRHAAIKALEITPNVTVVLGDMSVPCQQTLHGLPVTIVVNENYQEGIGSSIACAVSALDLFDGVLVTLCDQPFIPTSHLKQMFNVFDDTPEEIVASYYDGKRGVPALFPKRYFPKLKSLSKERGAKSLLRHGPCREIQLDLSLAVDIDTPEDLAYLER